MAKRNAYDYLSAIRGCPQYVDFSSALEEPDEVFLGIISPECNRFPNEACTPLATSSKIKSRAIKPTQELDARVFQLANTTDSQKLVLGRLEKRLSRSEASLFTVKKNPELLRRRSISESATKEYHAVRAKKPTYPTTPRVLRRTLYKARPKVKTTEELELEKIAELRQQTCERLRSNAIALRRLGMKQPRSCTVKKGVTRLELKTTESKLKEIEKGHAAIPETINAVHVRSQLPEETGRRWPSTRSERMKWIAGQLNEIRAAKKPETDMISFKKFDTRSGLKFLDCEKRGAFKPFNLKVRNLDSISSVENEKETKTTGQMRNLRHFLGNTSTPRFNGKENITSNRFQHPVVRAECKSGIKTVNRTMKNSKYI